MCAENHVRTWTVTRFRGRISTQPGSSPIASFKLLSLEGSHSLFYPENSIGEMLEGYMSLEVTSIQTIIYIFCRLSVLKCTSFSIYAGFFVWVGKIQAMFSLKPGIGGGGGGG